MTTQLITDYFRLHNANQFKESVSETANSVYYVFAAKHTPYANGDSIIPDITNTVDSTFKDPYREMVFGKRVTPTSVSVVAPRYNWTTNTAYSAYRSNEDMSGKQYFVCVDGTSAFHIFKCLDNNGNVVSTIAPDVTQTSPDDPYYSTSDGYVWKYMYSVDSTTFNTFATNQYMPVTANGFVVANAVSGAIDVIVVSYGGSNYNTYLSNTFLSSDLFMGGDARKFNIANNASSSSGFYTGSYLYITGGTGNGQGSKIVGYTVEGNTKIVTLADAFTTSPSTNSVYEITPSISIEGDGDGAVARALVNTSHSNSVYEVQILQRGSGYTRATATVLGNTGGVSNAAVLSIVGSPKGGHGSNPEYELGAASICISVSFANSESGTIPIANDYRAVGILKDPLYANVQITVGSPTGAFTVGETITQANTGAQGVVTSWDSISTLQLTSVNGVLLTGNTTVNYLIGSSANASVVSFQVNGQVKNFNTFDQRNRYSFTPITGTFTADEQVYQTDVQLANAVFHSNGASNVYLTHINGVLNTGNTIVGSTSGATANLTVAYPPDLIVGSGEVLYYENESPITRSNTQTETVKVILQF